MRTPPVFKKIKESVLGKRYDLSVVFLSLGEMKKVDKKFKIKKVSNVLSFPLSPASGEVLICLAAAKPFTPAFLFIHGCLHLKGHKHSATMESQERRILKKFGLETYE